MVTRGTQTPGGTGDVGGAQKAIPALGLVAFHDTNLGMMAKVDLTGTLFTTDNGRFALTLRPGTHTYELLTLLGTHHDDVTFSGSESLRLEMPAFPGWSPMLFDNIAFGSARDFTIRWERERNVNVWIEPYPIPSAEQAARAALRDWQAVLKNTIIFTFVSTAAEADMTMSFVPQFRLPGYRTIGTCTRWYSASTGFIVRSEIHIATGWADHLGLHRHEIGHCIGLGHSHVREHVMYPVLYNDSLTPAEQDIARLLYSVPPKTQRLTHATATQAPDEHSFNRYVEPVGGLVVEVVR